MVRGSSTRFFSLLAGLAILIASIVVYSVLLKPAYEDVNQLRGDLASKSALVREQRRVIEKVKELLDQYPSLVGPRQRISLALPNEVGYPTLLNQINGLTKAAGLTLQSVSLSLSPFSQTAGLPAGPNAPVMGIIQINFDVSGNYQALKNLLETIETNIRIMDLVSLSINPGSSGANYNYHLVVNTYYQTLK